MAKYKIELDKDVCISTFACTIEGGEFWSEDDEDGKAKLTNATYNEGSGKWELIIEDADIDANRNAADSCPVAAIKVSEI